MHLYQYLIQNDVSQTQFADKLGISQPTLSRYLIGSTYPTVVSAIQIERLTNGKVKCHDWANLERDIKVMQHG